MNLQLVNLIEYLKEQRRLENAVTPTVYSMILVMANNATNQAYEDGINQGRLLSKRAE